MGWNREAELVRGWELWSRGELESCKLVNAQTDEVIELPGDVLKALAREYLQSILEKTIEELAK